MSDPITSPETPCNIVWFRDDLRTIDHEPLHRAASEGLPVACVYCFDDRAFGADAFGFKKTGPFRARFLIESVEDLRRRLRNLGGALIVRMGRPEDVLPQVAQACNARTVFAHEQVTDEELRVESAVEKALTASGVELDLAWGHTLHHPDDLPFDPKHTPPVFTKFRKRIEAELSIRPTLPAPTRLSSPEGLEPGQIPSLAELGLDEPELEPRAVIDFIGGESAGLERIQEYIWEADALRHYKQTRNGMLNADDSSKLSAWLAAGCLSPRTIYEQVLRYEQERTANESTYWLVFELRWRDYFRFICLKHGNDVFKPAGIQGIDIPWSRDAELFEAWRTGRTGIPFIDANMTELNRTGYMSNRGRQNVGSFLTKNLGIDWRLGAAWFESRLVDYDVCSNWGNWNYTAGVGNDARGFRYFNIPKQAGDYDPQGEYVKRWLPRLKRLPPERVHRPWEWTEDDQRRFGVQLGKDYPQPVVDLEASAEQQRRTYERAVAQ